MYLCLSMEREVQCINCDYLFLSDDNLFEDECPYCGKQFYWDWDWDCDDEYDAVLIVEWKN